MKKALTIFLICFLLSGLIEKSKGQNTTNQQRSVIEKQVDSVFHSMIVAADNLEYDKLAQGVDDHFQAGFISNNSYYARFDSLITVAKSKVQNVKKQLITIQKEKITVLSDSIVLLTAIGDTEVDLNSGNSVTVKFFWTFVYEKINKSWKVVQSHQSNTR
jgi:hypothetical protein